MASKQTEDRGKCACGGCKELFGSLSAFDSHRVGPWADRRCLGPVPMVEHGLRKGIDGRWRRPDPRGDRRGLGGSVPGSVSEEVPFDSLIGLWNLMEDCKAGLMLLGGSQHKAFKDSQP